MRRPPLIVAFLVALAALTALAPPAFAREKNPFLAEAQAAYEDLRYEDAARLLDRAYRLGGSSRAELLQIFRLQGEVAATLGDGANAELAFRRLLALDPSLRLPAGTSPKITTSFDAARRWFGARDGLRIEARTHGSVAVVLIASDPLHMAFGALLRWVTPANVEGTARGAGSARVELPLPPSARSLTAEALDEFGNTLASIDLSPPEPEPEREPEPGSSGSARRLYTRWWPYAALGAAFAATGAGFAFAERDAQADLDALNAASHDHDFREAQSVEDRLRRDALYTNIAFGAAGVCVIVAIVMALRHDEHAAIAPVATARSFRVEVRF